MCFDMKNRQNKTMASKLTRHDKFHYALSGFIKKFSKFLCELDDIYPGIENWDLENKTISANYSEHTYLLHIPTKFIAYEVDVRHQVNGVWNEPGPVYRKNEFIYNALSEQFQNHFGIYYRFDGYGNNMAYTNIAEMTEENDIVKCKIRVQYHSRYQLPFYIPVEMLSEKEKNKNLMSANKNLLLEVVELENLFDDLSVKYERIAKKYNANLDRTKNNNSRMQNKIRELYKQLGKCEDCPVCWEPISAETLIVPGCCHYICHGCNVNCKSCPLCREK